jgi:putative protease
VETCLIDHLPAIRKAGISELVIDARGRTGAYAGAMTQVYRETIARCADGSGSGDASGPQKERVKALAYGGITAGHFLRGLKE